MKLSEKQRDEVHEALASLIGMRLSDMWRYLQTQKFEFGEQKPAKNRKGEDITRADWGLVVNCSWRIDGPLGFVLSSDHFGPYPRREDEFANAFYERLTTAGPIVQSIEVGIDGDIKFSLSSEFRLTVVPSPKEDPRDEQWRFMTPQDDGRGHLVLKDAGLEWAPRSA